MVFVLKVWRKTAGQKILLAEKVICLPSDGIFHVFVDPYEYVSNAHDWRI